LEISKYLIFKTRPLYPFLLKYPDVHPTNNQAEQSIRNLVIFRKISFGTRSAEGSRTHSVLPSLILTAQRQDVHPLKFLQVLFTAETAIAQKVLFNNSIWLLRSTGWAIILD